MQIYIYALTDPRTDAVRYVGKAADVAFRVGRHIAGCKAAMRLHYPVNRWLAKLRDMGLKPEWKVLEQTTEADWVEAERRWIALLRSQGVSLLNVTDGGEGASYKSTPERNRKISDAKKGKPLPQEVRDKIAASLTGRKYPPNPRKSAASLGHKRLVGRVLPPAHRAQVLAAIRKPEVIAKRLAKLRRQAKSWIVVTPSGEEVQVENLVQFSENHGLDYGSMNKIAHGKQGRKQHKGYSIRPA